MMLWPIRLEIVVRPKENRKTWIEVVEIALICFGDYSGQIFAITKRFGIKSAVTKNKLYENNISTTKRTL